MIMWGVPVLGCALLVSALLLRRWPLAALAVTAWRIGGQHGAAAEAVAYRAGRGLACVAGLEICYIAATRTRRVSVTGAAMAARRPADSAPDCALSGARSGAAAWRGRPIHLVTIAVPFSRSLPG